MVITAYAMVYIVWGSTYFFIHKALAGFEPFMLGAVRFTFAGLLMLLWCLYKGYKVFDWSVIKGAGFTGLMLLFVDTGIIIWVEQFLASGFVAIMGASTPIWFVLLDKAKWKENFRSLPILAGLFLGFLGVMMLFGDQLASSADSTQRSTNLGGMLLLIFGAVAWTVGSLFSKYFTGSAKQANTNSTVNTGWQIFIAGVAFIVAAVVRGEAGRFDASAVPAEAWWSILYLVGFGSIVAYSSYIWLLKVRPATEVSTYAYVNPIVAVVLSVLFTDERVSSVQIIGLFVILLSVFLMNWNAYMKSRKPRVKALPQVRTRAKREMEPNIRSNAAVGNDDSKFIIPDPS